MAHLTKVVGKIAAERGVNLLSVSGGEVRAIERKLENGDIKIDQAIKELQGIEKIRFGLEKKDYERIEKEMK